MPNAATPGMQPGGELLPPGWNRALFEHLPARGQHMLAADRSRMSRRRWCGFWPATGRRPDYNQNWVRASCRFRSVRQFRGGCRRAVAITIAQEQFQCPGSA